MRQKLWRHVESFILPILDGVAEVYGIPVGDDCRAQIQSGDPVMLDLQSFDRGFSLGGRCAGRFSRRDEPHLY